MLKAIILASFLLTSGVGSGPSDEMFDTLKNAPSEEEAAQSEADILASWAVSGSGTVDLLLERAGMAEQAGEFDLARSLYDRVVLIAPDYPEGWYRRSVIFLQQENLPEALRDLNETLTLEPRHFPAWARLGGLLEALGSTTEALDAYQTALTIHPHLLPAKRGVARLNTSAKGQSL